MSRKNRKPIYTLSQDEAERLIAEVKNSVEKLFVMPAAGESAEPTGTSTRKARTTGTPRLRTSNHRTS